MKLLAKAKKYAEEKHRGQLYGEAPYSYHCRQTAFILHQITSDDNLIAAGYLHDILENTKITYEQLKKDFNEDIANLVKEVTKSSYNTFPYLHSRRGVILKFADRLSNLSNMEKLDEKKQQKYLNKSKFWKS